MDNKKKYYAFISYKREDEQWAKWLQQKLEHYKLPVNLNGRSDLPKEIRPVFKDTSELNPGNLPQQLHSALEQSRYLIVICSPRSAKSEWVNRELETFVEMGRTDKIIPFIIEGKPFSKSPEEECFPEAIRNLPAEQEILGANINEMGRDAAAVKVVSRMFGLKFDELWNRYEREQKRRRRFIVAGISALALLAFGVAAWIWHQNLEIKAKDWKMMESQSRLVAEKVIANASNDSYLARQVALEILPKDLSHPDRPYTPEAERALREANQYRSAIIRVQNIVGRACYSPDGKEIMVYSYDDSTFRFYDKTGGELRSFRTSLNCHGNEYSPNGQRILAFCDSVLLVFDAQKGNVVKSIVVDTSKINSAEFDSGGKRIITTSGHTIKIWDAEKGTAIKTIENDKFFKYAKYSPDGKLIVTFEKQKDNWWNRGEANYLIMLDAETYQERHKQTIHGGFNSIGFSPNGEKYLLSSEDYESGIKIWSVDKGELLVEINTDHTHNVSFCPNGDKILSSSPWSYSTSSENTYNTIKIWNAISGEELQTLHGHKDYVCSASFSPDGNQVISVSKDMTVRIWNLNQDDNSKVLVKSNARLFNAGIDPLNDLIAASCQDRMSQKERVRVWDLHSGIETVNLEQDNCIGCVAINPNGKQLAYVLYYVLGESQWVDSLSFVMSLNFYDLEKKGITKSITDTVDGFSNIAFSPDGKKLVLTTQQHYKIKLFDLQTDSVVWIIPQPSIYGSVEFSPDGKRVLYGDSQPYVFDAATGEEIFVGSEKSRSFVHYATYSHDGRLIASLVDDNTIRIWDAENGNCINTLEGHENGVLNVCFSPDGKYLASGSKDKTIRVWGLQSGTCVCIYKGHDASVSKVSFSSDGRQIISFSDDSESDDSSIRLWDFLPLQELIDQTREHFKDRPLTPEERRLYYLE